MLHLTELPGACFIVSLISVFDVHLTARAVCRSHLFSNVISDLGAAA